MRDLNDRRAGIIESFEELHDLVTLSRMKVPRGLVGKNQFRVHNHRAGHAHKLLLSAGKLTGKQVLLANDIETIQGIANTADALFVGNILVRERHLEVFEDRQIVDQVIALKDKPDVGFVEFIALLDVEFVNGLSTEIEFTRPRAIQHADNAKQCGFPSA